MAPASRERVAALASDTARSLIDELGHGHSFSLDTDDELRKRVAFLKSLGGPSG